MKIHISGSHISLNSFALINEKNMQLKNLICVYIADILNSKWESIVFKILFCSTSIKVNESVCMLHRQNGLTNTEYSRNGVSIGHWAQLVS